ncbi:tyrocidine synthase 3 [Bacillus sp. CN2]|nr:tyrocidine synthase 3 [Bacillus velezensis]ARZ56505.1 Tyrocidine synthase 3 [Bacillus velezensis]GFR56127.1 tyrocidine synthase 3 [Bacillus sp. CN2]
MHYYNGFGEHGEMLSKGYLSGNTALINNIFKKQKNIHYLIKECNI